MSPIRGGKEESGIDSQECTRACVHVFVIARYKPITYSNWLPCPNSLPQQHVYHERFKF